MDKPYGKEQNPHSAQENRRILPSLGGGGIVGIRLGLARGFSHDSDVDVLVTFSKDAQISLFDLVQMQLDLENIFRHPVDEVEKDALENPFRKQEILKTAQVVYAV